MSQRHDWLSTEPLLLRWDSSEPLILYVVSPQKVIQSYSHFPHGTTARSVVTNTYTVNK